MLAASRPHDMPKCRPFYPTPNTSKNAGAAFYCPLVPLLVPQNAGHSKGKGLTYVETL